jgi:O-antigen/teichoic acid export membrane protein
MNPVVSQDRETTGTRQLGSTIRRSLSFSFADRYIGILVQVITSAILARLLSPEDFGVYTVGLVIVSLAQVVRDFGAIGYLLQEKDLTEDRIRTAFGVTLLIGCLLAGGLVASSDAIAHFYHNDGLRRVLLVLSANFLLTPFGSVALALLRRDMNFSALFRVNVTTAVVNSSVSVTLALLGFSFMSMAWGAIAAAAATSIAAYIHQPAHLSLVPSVKEWRRVASFGAIASVGNLANDIGSRAPELLVGRLLGFDALGLYTRADGLIAIFNRAVATAVGPVAVSALASRHRAGEDIKADFLKAISLITAIAWPFFIFLGLMAFPVTRILFGGGWDAAVPIARILSIAGAISALANLNWSVFQGTGAVRQHLWVQLIVQPVNFILIAAASLVSLDWVAMAVIVTSTVSVWVSYHFVNEIIGASILDIFRATQKSLLVGVVSSIVPLAVIILIPADAQHIWSSFCIAGAGTGLAWCAGLACFRHPLFDEVEPIWAVLRLRLPLRSL